MISVRQLDESDYMNFKKVVNEFRQSDFSYEKFIDTLNNCKKTSEIWLIIDNNEIVGIGTIIFEHKFIFNTCIYAHLEDICIVESHRNRGLGTLMVKTLLDRAKQCNCLKVTLDCADHNIIFYEKCGLERRGNQMCQLTINL